MESVPVFDVCNDHVVISPLIGVYKTAESAANFVVCRGSFLRIETEEQGDSQSLGSRFEPWQAHQSNQRLRGAMGETRGQNFFGVNVAGSPQTNPTAQARHEAVAGSRLARHT